MSGTVVSVSKKDNTLVVKHDAGKPQTHNVDPAAVVTLNGQPSDLAHLKAGDVLTYHGDPVTLIDATRDTQPSKET